MLFVARVRVFGRPPDLGAIAPRIGPSPDPATRFEALIDREYLRDLIQPGGPNYELTAHGAAALAWWSQQGVVKTRSGPGHP